MVENASQITEIGPNHRPFVFGLSDMRLTTFCKCF